MMTPVLADASSAVAWAVAGVGIAALVAAGLIAVFTERSRRRARRPGPGSNGLSLETAVAGSAVRPNDIRTAKLQPVTAGPPGIRTTAPKPAAEVSGGSSGAHREPGMAADLVSTPANDPLELREPEVTSGAVPAWFRGFRAPSTARGESPMASGQEGSEDFGQERSEDFGQERPAGLEEHRASPMGEQQPSPMGDDAPSISPPAAPSQGDPAPGRRAGPFGAGDVNLRGVLRWLLFETDADAVALLQVVPGGEQLFIEPRGLPDRAVADLARGARDTMLSAGAAEHTAGEASASRWLGVRGSNLLYLTGASPIAAAEPLRFARFAIEWLAGSGGGQGPHPSEQGARSVPGVAWAEMAPDGRLRVLPTEPTSEGSTAEALGEALPGQAVQWVAGPQPELAKRAQLLDVFVTESEGTPAAEVRVLWEGAELSGVGRGHTSLVGRHLAAARGTVDALKPLVHAVMHLEHLQISTLPTEVEVVLVSLLVDDERLVGATVVSPEDELRAGAKAVLDAVNRRLAVLAGKSGQL
jgi:hypothetical protein